MCFEFVHTCAGPLIDQISELVGLDNYFMVCIGHLNYFYCQEAALIIKVKNLLINKGIALHKISENEFISIINFQGTNAFQIIHGNKVLLNSLQVFQSS